jgi:PAS domain-containing protein
VAATPKPKDVVLILAREFASKLAFAVLIADADGNLVYFNEPAERLLGRTYAETGELSATQWAPLLMTEGLDGTPLPLEQLPGGIALLERRPAHRNLAITGLDGVRREISATAFPLLSSATELVGMMAIFWRLDEGVSA